MDLNLICPVNTLGYGVVGLNLLKALSQHHSVAWWPRGSTECSFQDKPLLQRCRDAAAFYNGRAPSLRIASAGALDQHVGKGVHAALPVFELDSFTGRELHQLQQQDVLFTPSQWSASVFRSNGLPAQRLCVVPFGVDASLLASAPEANASATTVFLNVGKWEVRKGHPELLEAFNRAFTSADDVRLILHPANPFLSAAENAKWNAQWESSPLRDKITVVAERFPSQRKVFDLMRKADCGVFPSRAEGWNLPLAEMLALGKSCIATLYGAHTEFCTADNCLPILVDELEEAQDGKWFVGQGRWGKFGPKQVDQLVEHLRYVHCCKRNGLVLHRAAIQDSMRPFTWERTAALIVDRLQLEVRTRS
jgi:glycosyltransferase involved in cell wall biosynthesis